MVDFSEHFKDELNSNRTSYFILDTAGPGEHGDVDFEKYNWDRDKFNRVSKNDLFIYRRPQNASEISGQFYFFGAGKIERIESIGKVRVKGIITKPFIFRDKLLKDDLKDFQWKFKRRGATWEHFFNQYGMNQIPKEDFMNLLLLQQGDSFAQGVIEDNSDIEVELYQQQQRRDYHVDDHTGNIKVRGAGQKIFADQVKTNYGYTCALTGIQTKEFLVASHIVPWSVDKDNRLNPRNGICLSTLVDRAFDQGYIAISSWGNVMISNAANDDEALYQILWPYQGQKLKVKRSFAPDEEFLKWHRENVYKK